MYESSCSHIAANWHPVFIPSVYVLLVGSGVLQRDRCGKILSCVLGGGIRYRFAGKFAQLGGICRIFVAALVGRGTGGRVFGGMGVADGWWIIVGKILTARQNVRICLIFQRF